MAAALTAFDDIYLTLIGFAIFFTLFLFFAASTYLKSEKEIHSKMRVLPLEEPQQGRIK